MWEEMASKAIQTLSKPSVSHAETHAERPKRVCSRKSYREVETDDEFSAEDVKQYRPKGKSVLNIFNHYTLITDLGCGN